MTSAALFWLLLFAAAALVFFGIALVVTIRGMSDLRDLLRGTEREPQDR